MLSIAGEENKLAKKHETCEDTKHNFKR